MTDSPTQRVLLAIGAGLLLIVGFALCADRENAPPKQAPAAAAPAASSEDALAERAIAAHLGENKLGIQAGDLRRKANPKGEGRFVYVNQTRFSGVERYVVWLVIDGEPYPLNGATKDVTPSLPWPREAPPDLWSRTGLDQYSATEALAIVFGKQGT